MSEMTLDDMDIILTVLYGALLLALPSTLWLLVGHLSSYIDKKGTNLATKEDTSEITQRIEGARTAHSYSNPCDMKNNYAWLH